MKTKLEYAIAYAKTGWPVFPLHIPMETGECSCNRTECHSIGKHPRIKNGFKEASKELEQVKSWWEAWPTTNIGIRTGTESGIIVLDVDPRHGGDKTLVILEKENEVLPKTVESLTGGGGRHIFFKHPGYEIKNSAGKLGEGLDIRGDGGYIVAPPSRHASGKSYEWKQGHSPEECAIAPLPSWLENLLQESTNQPTPPSSSSNGVIPEGQRNQTLFSLAGTMRKRGMSQDAIETALIVENESRCRPPLEEEEVLNIARNISKYKTSQKQEHQKDIRYKAHFDGLIDLVTQDGKIVFLTSEGLKNETVIDDETFFPPPKDQIQVLWLLPRAEECLRYAKEDSDAQLYDDLVETAKSVSILPSEHHYHLLAAWIMHTYHLDHESYSPMLAFDAVPDRGKSRTGKFLTYVIYRGVRVAEMREANLIRYAKDFRATLFFDLRDAHRMAQKHNCEDLMLNRFEKGTLVSRTLSPDKGAFKDMTHFEVFGATVIATNESLGYILESRGITIVMPEVDKEQLSLFNKDIVPQDFLSLKERLVAFRLRHLKDPLPEVDKPAIRRLGDIMRPLVRIVRGVNPAAEVHLTELIHESETERQLSRAETFEGRILRAFIIHAEEGNVKNGKPVVVADVCTKLNAGSISARDLISSAAIGKCLKKVGFKRARGKDNTAAYLWDSALSDKLKVTWGLSLQKASPSSPLPQSCEIEEDDEGSITEEEFSLPI